MANQKLLILILIAISLARTESNEILCLFANYQTGLDYSKVCKIINENKEIEFAWKQASDRDRLTPMLYPLIIGGTILGFVGFVKSVQHAAGCAVDDAFGNECGLNPGYLYFGGSGLCLAAGIGIEFSLIRPYKNKAKRITFEFIKKNAS